MQTGSTETKSIVFDILVNIEYGNPKSRWERLTCSSPQPATEAARAGVTIALPCDENGDLSYPFFNPDQPFMGENLIETWGDAWRGDKGGIVARAREQFVEGDSWDEVTLKAQDLAGSLVEEMKTVVENYRHLYFSFSCGIPPCGVPPVKRYIVDLYIVDLSR